MEEAAAEKENGRGKGMLKKSFGKWGIAILIQLLIVLALLPGCLKKEELVYSRTDETLEPLGAYSPDRMSFRSDFMRLTPGVYQVRVYSDVRENQRMSVELCYETGPYRAVKTNSVTVFPNDEYIDFKAYVSYEIPDAYLQFAFEYMDISGVQQVDVWKTNAGARVLLFSVFCGFLLLDGMLIFRKRILEGRVTGQQQLVFWTLTAGVLLAYFPFMTDYVQNAGKGMEGYLSRLGCQSDPLLYIPAVFMKIGFSLMTAYKAYALLVTAATAWSAYYSFRKCVENEYAALFGSVVYLLAPYRLFSLYDRANLGEFVSMMFLPLIGGGLYCLCTKKKTVLLLLGGLALLLVGMTVTLQRRTTQIENFYADVYDICNIQGMIMLAILLLYALWRVKAHKGSKICSLLMGFLLLAMLVSVFSLQFMPLTTICMAMAAMSFFAEVRKIGGDLIKIGLGIVGVMVIVASTFYTNEVAIRQAPLYIYVKEAVQMEQTATIK